MIKLDMWYNNQPNEVNRADCFFYPSDGTYRGNLYTDRKCIGDYIARDSVELNEFFERIGIAFKWH